MRPRAAFILAVLLALLAPSARAAFSTLQPGQLARLAIKENLGGRLPLDVPLRDAQNRETTLGALFQGRPVLLLLGYFHCPDLCGLERRGMIAALDKLSLVPGRDFQIAVISVDPRETPADGRAAKAADLALYGRPGAGTGWHYLTGTIAGLRRLAGAAGFPFRYDAAIDQYAHPVGLVLASPDGVIARYILGFDYTAQDVRLGLVDAAHGAIAAPATQLLLLCYHYDPAAGRYGLLVGALMKIVGAVTLSALALLIGVLAWPRRRIGRG